MTTINAVHATVTTLVDGALDEEHTFYDYLVLDEYLTSLLTDLQGEGYDAEVYILHHDAHVVGAECECAQYSQDHTPYWSNAQ